MPSGALNQHAESATRQCRAPAAGGRIVHRRCRRRALTRLCHLDATSIPLRARGSDAAPSVAGRRAFTAHHVQTSRRRRASVTCVLFYQRHDVERDRDTRDQGVFGFCDAQAWLSGAKERILISAWTTSSIVSYLPNCSSRTRFLFPTVSGPLAIRRV